MLPYYFLITFFILLSALEVFSTRWNTPIPKRVVYGVVALVYLFFFGLRGFVGWDTLNYYANYMFSCDNRFEVGYRFLVYLSHQLGLSYFTFVFLLTTLQFTLLWRFLKRSSSYPIFSLLICMLVGGLNLQIETLRYTLMLVFFLNALEYMGQRRLGYFLAWMIPAFFFHQFAVGLFALYFAYTFFFSSALDTPALPSHPTSQSFVTPFGCSLTHHTLSPHPKRLYLLYTLIALGGLLTLFHLSAVELLIQLAAHLPKIQDLNILVRLQNYMTVTYFNNKPSLFSLPFLYALLLSVPILLCRRELLNHSPLTRFYYQLFVLSWLVYFFCIGLFIVWFRIYLLTFTLVFWILFPFCLQLSGQKLKVLLFVSLVALLSVRTLHTLRHFPYMRYTNILFEQDHYQERLEFRQQFDKARGLEFAPTTPDQGC